MKNTSIAAVDATNAIFTLHQEPPPRKRRSQKSDAHTKLVKDFNENSITKSRFPVYYKSGLGVIDCVEFVFDNEHSPYYILTRRHRKYIRRVVNSGKVKKTLNYYCKIVKKEEICLIEVNGKIVATSKIPDH